MIDDSPLRHDNSDGHKTCRMNAMTTHMRVHVLDDGKFQSCDKLRSQTGELLEENLLRIEEVICP